MADTRLAVRYTPSIFNCALYSIIPLRLPVHVIMQPPTNLTIKTVVLP